MILGVIIGTYSSIFIANPILVNLNVNHFTVVKKEEEKININFEQLPLIITLVEIVVYLF